MLSVIHKPGLVFLGEVSTGLDIEVREEIFEFLEENIVNKNVTIVLFSHNMSEIERFCTCIIYMRDGDILEICTVKDVVKEYGSVHNYTFRKFKKYKKPSVAVEKELLNNTKGQNNPNKVVNSLSIHPKKQRLR